MKRLPAVMATFLAGLLLTLAGLAEAATLSLTAPANNSQYHAPSTLALTASVTADAGTPIARVDFYADDLLLGSDSASPWRVDWLNPPAGTYTLTARATDSAGTVTTSAARTLTITAENAPPTISLTAPAGNSQYYAPASLTLSANASGVEANTPITQVEFFANDVLIGSDSTSPWSVAWANPPAGTYVLTARATDSGGATRTSLERTVTVTAANAPPTVSLTAPANNARYYAPASLTLSASASGVETNTPVTQVEFYANDVLIGSDTASPWSVVWNAPPAGTYTLTAKATDSTGTVTTSAARTLTITADNQLPTVSLSAPANNSQYYAPASLTVSANASGVETNTPIAQVELFAGTQLLATLSASPYRFDWANPPAGVHTLTARATDSAGGQTLSAARTVTISATHTLANLSLTAPANNAQYHAPASLTLSASASGVEANTPLTRVDFYANDTLIGSDTASPWSVVWNAPPAGTHTLIAKATDSSGAVVTSAARTLTVTAENLPPTVSLTAPANNSQYFSPASLTLSASTSGIETNTPITQLEFLAGTEVIATLSASPWTYAWANPPAGVHTLTARATDSGGATTTSAARTVTLTASNTPPTVNLTAPANSAKYYRPASLTLSASASGGETNTPVTQVEFFANDQLIGSDTASPWSLAWENPAPGTYTLTARATDSSGASASSAARTLTITADNQPPTVSLSAPANNSRHLAASGVTLTASASGVETNTPITKLEFLAGTEVIATLSASPWTTLWTTPPLGAHVLTARATDSGGATTTSAAKSITVVDSNLAPTITITAPTDGTVLKAPATVPLTATVTDADGKVVQVAFYRDTTLIATVKKAPFATTWADVPIGRYALTAVATDDLGTKTRSPAVTLTVNNGDPEGMFFIHADHLGTPRLIADEQQQTVWRWDNEEAFGDNLPNEDPAGVGSNFVFNLRFPGQYFDKETNLSYNYFRDYDPSTGRYVQSDPIGLVGGSLSLYTYADNAPTMKTDPLGLQAIPAPPPAIPGFPTPGGQSKPRDPDNPFDPPSSPRWKWPSFSWPSWLTPKSPQDRCEDECENNMIATWTSVRLTPP